MLKKEHSGTFENSKLFPKKPAANAEL